MRGRCRPMLDRWPSQTGLPSADALQQPLFNLLVASGGAAVCAAILMKFLPKTSVYRHMVLGTASEDARARDSLALLNWGYTAFEAVKVYGKGQAISQLKVFRGVQNQVGAGFAEDFVVSVPRGMADKVSAQLVSKQPLIAPIAAGMANPMER